MNLPAFALAEIVPPELLSGYTPQQLSTALVMLNLNDAQQFAKLIESTDVLAAEMRAASAGSGPLPRLSADFQAEIMAVIARCPQTLANVRQAVEAMRQLRADTADVLARYEAHAKEVRAVLQTVKDSPRG